MYRLAAMGGRLQEWPRLARRRYRKGSVWMSRHTIVRTSKPAFPEHPKTEHEWRLERARRLLKEAGLDALVLARNVNVHYLSGSRFVFVGKDGPSLGKPQSTAIVTSDADIYCQRFGAFDSDDVSIHTTWQESLESYDDELELVNILRDYGIGRGSRIGTGVGSWAVSSASTP